MWQLGCWRHEAVCRFGHAFPIFIFWNNCLEVTRFPGKHGGSAPQVLGCSACVPKADSVQGSQDLAAKLCTYFAWFFCPSQWRLEPYLDIPMSISRLRLLIQFRKGSHQGSTEPLNIRGLPPEVSSSRGQPPPALDSAGGIFKLKLCQKARQRQSIKLSPNEQCLTFRKNVSSTSKRIQVLHLIRVRQGLSEMGGSSLSGS